MMTASSDADNASFTSSSGEEEETMMIFTATAATAANAKEKIVKASNDDEDEDASNGDTSTESADSNIQNEEDPGNGGDFAVKEDLASTSTIPTRGCNPSTMATTNVPVNRACTMEHTMSRAKATTTNTMKRASEGEPTPASNHGKKSRNGNVNKQVLEEQQSPVTMLKRNIQLPTAKCRAKKRLFDTKLQLNEGHPRIILHEKKPRIKFKVSSNNKKKLRSVESKKKYPRVWIKRKFKLPLCRPQHRRNDETQQEHPEADAICLSADKRYAARVNAALIRKEIYILTSNVSDEDMTLLRSLCSMKRLDGVKFTILKEFSDEATVCITQVESSDGKAAATMIRTTTLMLASLVGIPIASISMIKSWQSSDEIMWPIATKNCSRNRLIARSFHAEPGQGHINMDYGIARMTAAQVLPLAGYYVILAKDVGDMKDLVEAAGAVVQVLEPAKITERSSKKLVADVHRRTENVVFVGSFPKKLEPLIANENVQVATWVYNAILSGRIPQTTDRDGGQG